ncbi:MAG: M23 family metallopeptidase [Bacilli bacterium]|nr:M23 family metallopeptidase [Bacilli bacterium]
MKKIFQILIFSLLSLAIIYLGFNYKSATSATVLYKVYLNDEVIGVINSKQELEKYIDKQCDKYKNKYGVNKVYAPNGLEIKRISTYDEKISTIEDIFDVISSKSSFTILGYEFNIKKEDEITTIYTTKEDIFEQSIDNTIKTFVGEDIYNDYKEDMQDEITTTGKTIENVYIDEDITVKQTNISVDETIYTDSSDLSKFLLFGTTEDQKTYTVLVGDTIEDVAFNNGISVEEFLISNPTFTSSKNLLFPGQQVVIGITNPKVSVVVVEYSVSDMEINYQTEYQYDENKSSSEEDVIQTGENGLERVTQRTKIVNGVINYVKPISKEELKPTISEIILKGKKVVSGVGSSRNWLWPTNSGYTISSGYTYRINPITGVREIHQALDIAGTGLGSPVYAVTNGMVSLSEYQYEAGNYVCINHNVNNLYSCYAHMTKRTVTVGSTVERGQIIGYVGKTGWATGPHLHFEVWIGKPWYGGYRINPFTMY